MKKNIVSRVLALLLLMTCYSAYGYSGYYAPYEGTTCINQGWSGGHSHGIADGKLYTNGSKLAYALDIKAYYRKVLAVKDGKIVSTGFHKKFGHFVVIEHDDGLYSQYIHLSEIKITSGFVHRGTVIAISGSSGTYAKDKNGRPAPHLHIQFSIKKELITDMESSRKVDFQGFSIDSVDKINHIPCEVDQKRTSKNVIYTGSNASPTNSSVFDGAGSLIDPDTQCAGCNFDIAKMHPHAPLKSTVVFQWLFDDLSCQFINLTTNSNKELPVSIHLKKWDAHETQTAYKTTLYSDTSISIAKEGEGEWDWTTFAVTSQQPIKDAIEITASCEKSSADYTQPQDRENIPLDLVDVGLGNYWTGTGSIISKAKTRTGFGVNKDYAVTFSKHKSLTSFQWYASSICKSVTVRDIKTPTKKIKASVAIKIWNSKTFDKVCDSLPCTLVEKPQRWYVIKVKTAKGAVSSGGLETICN